MASQGKDPSNLQGRSRPFLKPSMVDVKSFKMKGALNQTDGPILPKHGDEEVQSDSVQGRRFPKKVTHMEGASYKTHLQDRKVPMTHNQQVQIKDPVTSTRPSSQTCPLGNEVVATTRQRRGSFNNGQSVNEFKKQAPRRSSSVDRSKKIELIARGDLIGTQRQSQQHSTVETLMSSNRAAFSDKHGNIQGDSESFSQRQGERENVQPDRKVSKIHNSLDGKHPEKVELEVQKRFKYTNEFNVDRDILHLIEKHPFEESPDVKVIPDTFKGLLCITGSEEEKVKHAQMFIVNKIEHAVSHGFKVPKYHCEYLQKDTIQDLLSKTLLENGIHCYWKVDQRYVVVVAWERLTLDRFHDFLEKVCRCREFRVNREGKAQHNFLDLYQSQHWDIIENGMKAKFKDLLHINTFTGDDGHMYLGIVAPKGVYKAVIEEIKVNLASHLKSKQISRQQTFQEPAIESGHRTPESNKPPTDQDELFGKDEKDIPKSKLDQGIAVENQKTCETNDGTDTHSETGRHFVKPTTKVRGAPIDHEKIKANSDVPESATTNDRKHAGDRHRGQVDRFYQAGPKQRPPQPPESRQRRTSQEYSACNTENKHSDSEEDIKPSKGAQHDGRFDEREIMKTPTIETTGEEKRHTADDNRKEVISNEKGDDDTDSRKHVIEFKPNGDEWYFWKFVIGCQTIYRRMYMIVKTDFTMTDEGFVRVNTGEHCHCEQALRDAFNKSSEGIKCRKISFATQHSECVKKEIETLKTAKITGRRTVNPCQTGDATIDIVEKEGCGEIVLVALDTYFDICVGDIRQLLSNIQKQADEGSDGKFELPSEEHDARDQRGMTPGVHHPIPKGETDIGEDRTAEDPVHERKTDREGNRTTEYPESDTEANKIGEDRIHKEESDTEANKTDEDHIRKGQTDRKLKRTVEDRIHKGKTDRETNRTTKEHVDRELRHDLQQQEFSTRHDDSPDIKFRDEGKKQSQLAEFDEDIPRKHNINNQNKQEEQIGSLMTEKDDDAAAKEKHNDQHRKPIVEKSDNSMNVDDPSFRIKDIQSEGQNPSSGYTSISCEEWKFDYLKGHCRDISSLEKKFNVKLEMKDHNALYIHGKTHDVLSHVKTEVEYMINTMVRIIPAKDEVYVWRFAFTSPTVYRSVQENFQKYDAEATLYNDTVIVRYKREGNIQSDKDLAETISSACKVIRSHAFKFSMQVRDDIEEDLRGLKQRKETPLRRVNHFKSNDAEYYIPDTDNTEQILLLVALETFFNKCYEDVLKIIKDYDKESNRLPEDGVNIDRTIEGHRKSDDVEANEKDVDRHNTNNSRPTTGGTQSSTVDGYAKVPSVSMNCEKWKFECLRKIDAGINAIEREFNVTVELKNDTTLCIEGKTKDNIDSARVDIKDAMKQVDQRIHPVSVEDYENLDADQDRKEQVEKFEKRHSVEIKLGRVLDYEVDVQISMEEVTLILTKGVTADSQMTELEIQSSQQGVQFVFKTRTFTQDALKALVDYVLKQSTDQTMAIHLDKYEGEWEILPNLVSDFIGCLTRMKQKGSVYTLYICTQRARIYIIMKEFFRNFNSPILSQIGKIIVLEVVQGELAKQKADVIVNSSNENLDLTQGTVSKSLLKEAGWDMQHEIDRRYRKPIQVAQIAVTKGYRLAAKHVLHSCLCAWNFHSNEKQSLCKQVLRLFVNSCLKATEELKHRSIAFPALGTGVLKFPPEVVAEEMINTVHEYKKGHPNTCIEKVLFVIYFADKRLYQIFNDMVRKLTAEDVDSSKFEGMHEHCVVIAGKKENVSKAKSRLKTELLSPVRMELSGRQKDNLLDISGRYGHPQPSDNRTHGTPGNKKTYNSESNRKSQIIPLNEDDPVPFHKGSSAVNEGIDNRIQDSDYATIDDSRGPYHKGRGAANERMDNRRQDSDYATIDEYYTGLTPDKGAIPKTTGATYIPRDLHESPASRLGVAGSQDGHVQDRREDELKAEKANRTKRINPSRKVDETCDIILDKYLEDITVSLNTEVFGKFGKPQLNGLKKNIQKDFNTRMDVDKLTIEGKACSIASTEERLIEMIKTGGNLPGASDDMVVKERQKDISSGVTTDTDSSESDVEDEYVEIDPNFEQSVLEKTLSRVDSGTDNCRQLKNVRREVYMLLKEYYRNDWDKELHGCDVDFYNGDITVKCGDDQKLMSGYRLVKTGVRKLEDFYYYDLESNKPAEDVLNVCRHVKGGFQESGQNAGIHFYEDDGMVRLAGPSVEQVDEFSKLVGLRLKGNTPRARGNRKLDAVSKEADDKSVLFQMSLISSSDGRSSTTFKPEAQKGCKCFVTDEGMKVYVYRADILHLKVEGIVNAANSTLKHGGGIAKVIAKAAGPAFEKESRDYIATHQYLPVGHSCTTGAGLLNYKRVIHTVGPCMSDYSKDEVDKVQNDLYDAIYTSLQEVEKAGIRSVGIPSVSSGVFGVPKKWCASQYCLAVKDFSKCNWSSNLKEVHFIDIDEEMLHIIDLTSEVVFNANTKAKTKLKKLKCTPNENQKAKVLRFFNIKKNHRRQKSIEDYPRIRHSIRSKIKFDLTPTFHVAVRKGNIVDFEKGVIVCNQDSALKCEGGVARAIIERDDLYKGNLHQRYTKRRYDIGEVLVHACKTLRCSHVYNVIVQHDRRRHYLDDVSLCYMQVLQKADENKVEKIALPLFAAGKDQRSVEESAKALSSVLIELVNSKGRHHNFPDVYIYCYDTRNVDILIRVMKDVLIDKNKPRKEPRYEVGKDSGKEWRQGPRQHPRQEPRKEPSNEAENESGKEWRHGSRQQPRQEPRYSHSDDDERYDTPPSSPVPQHDPRRSKFFNRQSSQSSLESSEGGSGFSLNKTHKSNNGGVDEDTRVNEKPNKDNAHLDGTMESMKCAICMDSFDNPKTLSKCNHTFCTECIDNCFKVKPVCPICSTPYGILTGTQPKGNIYDTPGYRRLPGYEKYGSIRIQYSFADGIQGDEHPEPGKPYFGTHRTAFLPDNAEGRTILKLLKLAFKRRLVFTIGRSVTTGLENVVTWNDIHHKTNTHGGPSNFGYPDPEYLTRVKEELAAKGVTEDDL